MLPSLFQQLGFFVISNAQNKGQRLVAIVLQAVFESAGSRGAKDACDATTGSNSIGK
jgi:hypothetical protein